ncbi:hypothetical protein BKA66DRAFT_478957 [Pyrenochaeta sp. MPI-SDFR-AT-0127]|nr:hypothetical protein BKA66DRAFT_478957 [Pyrenochaeta sp. MPI-SDFR-AT-0127]
MCLFVRALFAGLGHLNSHVLPLTGQFSPTYTLDLNSHTNIKIFITFTDSLLVFSNNTSVIPQDAKPLLQYTIKPGHPIII